MRKKCVIIQKFRKKQRIFPVKYSEKQGMLYPLLHIIVDYSSLLILLKDEKKYLIDIIGTPCKFSCWLNDLDEVTVLSNNSLTISKSNFERSKLQLNVSDGILVGFTNSGKILIRVSKGISQFDKLYLINLRESL